MRKQSLARFGSAQQGVVLLEALIAILIFSIGVLGIVGMQANMVKNTSESKYRADASYIAQQQIGLLWTNSDTLPGVETVAPVDLPNGTITITPMSDRQFRVTVVWTQPGEPQHTFATITNIVGEGEKP